MKTENESMSIFTIIRALFSWYFEILWMSKVCFIGTNWSNTPYLVGFRDFYEDFRWKSGIWNFSRLLVALFFTMSQVYFIFWIHIANLLQIYATDQSDKLKRSTVKMFWGHKVVYQSIRKFNLTLLLKSPWLPEIFLKFLLCCFALTQGHT